MPNYMSQIPPEPKPTAGPRMVKPQPAKGPRKPRGKMPEREMPKRTPKPKDAAKGIMGSTEAQAQARQKKTLDDMRKRMMLRKAKKSN